MSRRLLIRGGSIAAGHGVSRGYADIVGEWCVSKGVGMVNRSRFNDNSFDGIWSFADDVEPYRPDILCIHFGVDDAFFPVYRSEFKENLVRMVQRTRELFSAKICILTSHTFDDPYDMDAVNIFYRVVREVCVDLACEMISVHTYWAGYLMDSSLTNTDLVQKDTRYPNEHGHEVIAQAVIQRLGHLVKK